MITLERILLRSRYIKNMHTFTNSRFRQFTDMFYMPVHGDRIKYS